ncbi:MAG: hypothetical protein P5702_05700 [Limnospira sp. PMC 1291.21]|uniref:hypothetical protein n=1 Tax=unclassified Limnospira TaxID=2642885 RepID=UPI0028E1822E|nr:MULTISPECIES: hypothetical protein [unclassified Limnospira]MDT9176402.1 hypothetical protein [Limnospira sp. PMC 1238.20]MDT9186911.1 hypothetical protein [Limnospira sp. PMC 894.15]MDT9192217.1 hypothetical protein [Limnospira sp. PMC 1245.20]MDT9198298.1 hypothetical protein [Limnospira sp. PMC 1042.18]MDT9202596.1 hypothetical protein [Limnospira sp. PMC 1243.20]
MSEVLKSLRGIPVALARGVVKDNCDRPLVGGEVETRGYNLYLTRQPLSLCYLLMYL